MISFRPARRERVGLLVGLIGPSGGGKTWSALELATGLAQGRRFALIDTEARRALHYADKFDFDHGAMAPPFRPGRYMDAIDAADKAGYPVIVVDSFSHEHAGEGGLLDYHEEELQRMAGDDWKKRDACKMAAWIKPKRAHKQMVQRLLQVRAHLILCFRAEDKVKMQKDARGKTEIVPIGWQPVCDKNMPYELTASMLLLPDKPGVPDPLKMPDHLRPMFLAGGPIDRDMGERVAAWAGGGGDEMRAILRAIQDSADEDALKKVAVGVDILDDATKAEAREAYRARLRELRG